MASSTSFFLFFLLVSCLALEAAAGREVPPTDSKLSFDGSVWIPGLGRYMIPKKGSKSLDYNPITGSPGGNGLSIPGFGGSTGGRNYIPGGDDTFVPNPGTEVPVSGGGGIPVPSNP
ncbi:putative cell wall protein [Salvia hispanica]|uniref:putative cell wall protein n=1 Tax=Salvia hispanica TaxID=49212 RepID=UPI0020094279|nr:putative cell wall protein [Salvia hispanica]